MSEHFWYKEKFFRPEAPDDVVWVEFYAPIELEPQTWQCEVRIEADESIRQRIRASSSFAAIQFAFQHIRKVILEKYPEYLHDGVERVEHLIPRPIEWFYGDEIRLKTEAFMDDLRSQKKEEIRE